MYKEKDLEVFLKSANFWCVLYSKFVRKYNSLALNLKYHLSQKKKVFHGLEKDISYKIYPYLVEKEIFYYQKYRTWFSFKVLL